MQNQVLRRVDTRDLLEPIEIRLLPPESAAIVADRFSFTQTPSKESLDHLIEKGLELEEKGSFKAAFKCFIEAADGDMPLGHLFAGLLKRHGIGIPKNESSAYAHFCRAASLLLQSADSNAGSHEGIGEAAEAASMDTPLEYSSSVEMASISQSKDETDCSSYLQSTDSEGALSSHKQQSITDSETDATSNFRLLQPPAASSGIPAFGDSISKMKQSAASPSNQELAMILFELGMCNYYGWGTKRSYSTAYLYFRMASQLGDADALVEMARCYLKGHGVKKSKLTAARCYRLAEKQVGAILPANSWIYKEKYI